MSTTKLPAAVTEFVGREGELATGGRLLREARLLTLTGPAGVGKTRLAVELARRSDAEDVWFVELGPVRGARAPARALAIATGLAERRDPAQLAEALHERPGLIVLDNCEHLVEPCAELASTLLTGCPDLRILATSREQLGIAGEVVWRVPGLDLPDPAGRPGPRRLRGCDAVAFFNRAAERRLPGFALQDRQLATAARICGRLDANPLALELAAARIAHLTLEEIDRRLASALGEFWIRRGYLSEGRERLDRCLEVVETSGERPYRLLLASANLALRQSDFAGGRRAVERLVSQSRAGGDRSAEAHGHDLMGRLALEESSLDEADRELSLAMGLFRDLGDWRAEARVHWHRNMLAMRRGDLEAARAHLVRFHAIAETVANPWAIGHAHLALAHLWLVQGDHEAVERDLPAALRLLGAAVDRWALANAVRFAAARAIERGAPEQGLVLLSAADAMHEAIGARPGEAMQRFSARRREQALDLVPADVARAAQVRGRRMQLAEVVDLALEAVNAGGGSRAAACLTGREAEVARLMAGRATDREIAARLGISVRTVEKHAENIRSKLGLESRAGVAEALGSPAPT